MRAGQQRTHMRPSKRFGPLSVQRAFYPEQDCCHVYLLHPPGGVVGGDRLEMNIATTPESRTLTTTPGATKFYLSAGGTARVVQNFDVVADAGLEYLPQENIYFPGANVRATTCLNVDPDGIVLLWEKHCFGRPANREDFSHGEVVSEILLNSGDELLFCEKQRVNQAELQRSSGFRGNPVSGSFLVYGPNLDNPLLDALRELQPRQGYCGITRPLERLLLIRYMGQSTADVNEYFTRLWALLRPRVLQRETCYPRIWAT
jgi:urease accessory protein